MVTWCVIDKDKSISAIMSCRTVLLFFSVMISCHALKDYDITPLGFRVTKSSVEVFFKRWTFTRGNRYTDCDGEVNGERLATWSYITSRGMGNYDSCFISFPSAAKPVKAIKVIVDSRVSDFEFNNGTRWDLYFDMANVPIPVKVMFGKVNSYIVQRPKTLENGKLKVNGIFKMMYKGARPLYTTFRFDGVDLSALSAEKANVRAFANGENVFNNKVSIKNKITGRFISSELEIDDSLVKPIGGTRGLMFYGGTFQVTPYLRMTGSINIAFDIYNLYDKYYLFPFGSFAMLEPPRNNSIVTVKRNQYNIIPCLTIGASQFGFKYTPKLYRVNSDGSLSNTTSKFRRSIIGLYYREDSPVVTGDLAGVEGTYACELNYDVSIDGRREKRSIRRVFNVTAEN